MVNIIQADLKAMQTLIRLISAGARKEDISGLGVDWNIALYFSGYKQEIDAVRYWSTLERLNYSELVSNLIWNVIRSGAFCSEEFTKLPEAQPEHMRLLLSDLVQGGYMGAKEKDMRIESGMEYNRLLIRKKVRGAINCTCSFGK